MIKYIEEFVLHLKNKNTKALLSLWKEYTANDHIDEDECLSILQNIKNSDFASLFGKEMETLLPLLEQFQDQEKKQAVLSLLIDLQASNSEALATLAYGFLKEKYGDQPYFAEKIRIVGLRDGKQFQGAISHYEFLTHMNKGNFVYHRGGWGTGEILDVSIIREQLSIEFECVTGLIEMSFSNAFTHLLPLQKEHFLARRFGDPDQLEKEAKQDCVKIIKDLLCDLGNKTAMEIKEELCDIVIPEKEWQKWWQLTRAKMKKDGSINMPKSLHQPFSLNKKNISQQERLLLMIESAQSASELVNQVHVLLRNFPQILKEKEKRQQIVEKTKMALETNEMEESDRFSCLSTLVELGETEVKAEIEAWLVSHENLENLLQALSITALKKQLLIFIKNSRDDWASFFAENMLHLSIHSLKEFCLKSLNQNDTLPLFQKTIEELVSNPNRYPETFVWYFQKIIKKEKKAVDYPFHDDSGQMVFFEAFLSLLIEIENKPQYRDLVRKIYHLLTRQRYALLRQVLKIASEEYVREFLLLATKSTTLSEHDIRIFHSLIEVSHPNLFKEKKQIDRHDDNIIWTTSEGFNKLRQRMHHIGTVEIVQNAKEIEAARELGDLRENAEYKSAQEKRHRLQHELKQLNNQLQCARIISPEDISTDVIGIGTVVDLAEESGKEITYTLLGPWDVDLNNNVLSTASDFAKAMLGKKAGDDFSFQNKQYRVKKLHSFFDNQATIG